MTNISFIGENLGLKEHLDNYYQTLPNLRASMKK